MVGLDVCQRLTHSLLDLGRQSCLHVLRIVALTHAGHVALAEGLLAVLFFFNTSGSPTLLLLALHHLHHLNLAVLLNKLGGVHVTTTDANNQSTINDFGKDVTLTELILSLGDTLHVNCKICLVQMLSERLIYDITSNWFIQLYLLELKDFFAQVRVLFLEVLASLVESLQVLQERLYA